ncbi:MAG: hypothetical protein HWN81_12005 [Candidatus Lokiarchaeota archaeon]|nr:hypothetical protein [Candidatus Lokiarchaeota archaeon]
MTNNEKTSKYAKDTFVMRTEWINHTVYLTQEQKGDLWDALFKYHAEGSLDHETLPPHVNLVLSSMLYVMEENWKIWEEKREKRIEAGKKGGRPKKEKD